MKIDRLILSATKMYPDDSSCWQYKVYADIRGDSLRFTIPWTGGVKRQWDNRKR